MSLLPTRQIICFELPPDEQPYAAGIAQEIEATWGYERMPPEVGNVVVPDVATNLRRFGEARLYDWLFQTHGKPVMLSTSTLTVTPSDLAEHGAQRTGLEPSRAGRARRRDRRPSRRFYRAR
jgi:hypothetical protein